MKKSMRRAVGKAALVLAILIGLLVALLGSMQPAFAAPTPVGACGPIAAPGSYQVTGPIAAAATCITITASGVTLDLNGQTISCDVGIAFPGGVGTSCQQFNAINLGLIGGAGPVGISIGPGVTDVTVKGPGTISGFDTGILVSSSDALIKDVTVTGPPCPGGPFTCSRPDAEGILVTGVSGVNLSRNVVTNQAQGIVLKHVACPGEAASCVLNRNVVFDNFSLPIPCHGIWLHDVTGYTLTGNTANTNGENGFENAGIYVTGLSTGNTVTNNTASMNLGFGIATSGAFGGPPSGNNIVNNVALGNTAVFGYADLGEVSVPPGPPLNTWNNNNTCNTETGNVPAAVCNPGE